tara:strand:- start:809 stop:997 length:189 start_codon:yes stop_codon:yes gene_type:complete
MDLTEKQIVRALKRLSDNWNDDYIIIVNGSGFNLHLNDTETDDPALNTNIESFHGIRCDATN